VSSSDDDTEDKDHDIYYDEDDNEDFHEHDAQGCVYVQDPPPSSPPCPRVSSEVSGKIYNGRVIRDDTDDMINHAVYNYFKAADNGDPTTCRPSSPRRRS
jgi:hypothetical protein